MLDARARQSMSRWAAVLLCVACVAQVRAFGRGRVPPARRGDRQSQAGPLSCASGEDGGGSGTREQNLEFFDEAKLLVKAGSGGSGAITWKFLKGRQHGPPTGGDGGKGGDVWLVCDPALSSLASLRGFRSVAGDAGGVGQNGFKRGKDAKPTEVAVPPGTIVRCNATSQVLGELRVAGQRLLVARGGDGGGGNAAATKGAKAKGEGRGGGGKKGDGNSAKPPQGGQRRVLELELAVVADVGLIGFPNAGKSTLLSTATAARPKIANYPFTTLTPNLGVCDLGTLLRREVPPPAPAPATAGAGGEASLRARQREADALGSIMLADIPGLVEGAADGRGLGHPFLRHVRRCRLLLHLLDATAPVEEVRQTYITTCKELAAFDPRLARVPQVIVLNKMDDASAMARRDELAECIKEVAPHGRVVSISAATSAGVADLLLRTAKLLQKLQSTSPADAERRG